MPAEIRWSITSPWAQRRLCAFEPTLAEVLAAAPSLAAFYNDSHNAAMMTHTQEASADEVVEMFHAMRAAAIRARCEKTPYAGSRFGHRMPLDGENAPKLT